MKKSLISLSEVIKNKILDSVKNLVLNQSINLYDQLSDKNGFIGSYF